MKKTSKISMLPLPRVLYRPLKASIGFYRLLQAPTAKTLKSSVVPGTGLEPAHLTALDPKSSVSAIPPPGREIIS